MDEPDECDRRHKRVVGRLGAPQHSNLQRDYGKGASENRLRSFQSDKLLRLEDHNRAPLNLDQLSALEIAQDPADSLT